MKTTIKFIDATGKKVTAEISLSSGRFSMSGEYNGSMGQCFTDVKPANDFQKTLLNYWEMYHLNDMKAGTPEQTAALKSDEFKAFCNGIDTTIEQVTAHLETTQNRIFELTKGTMRNAMCDQSNRAELSKENARAAAYLDTRNKLIKALKGSHYEKALYFLEEKGILTVQCNGKPYTYGSAWLTLELPASFESDLLKTIEGIKEAETAKDEEGVKCSEMEADELSDEAAKYFDSDMIDPICALAIFLDLNKSDIGLVEVEDKDLHTYTVQGETYICCTDSEADELQDQEFENYIDECILPELKNDSLNKYFDRDAWKRDAIHDGRGHTLNRYDGSEEEQDFNGETFYIYRS